MDDFVSKPFSQEQLIAALQRGLVEQEKETAPGNFEKAVGARTAPNPETLDYDAVLHRCMGKRTLANRLIGKFVTGLEDDVARIKNLLVEQDWAEAAEAAHKVKGAAAALEAIQLRACLEDLERNLRQGVPVDVEVVAAELEKTSSDYRDAAETILQDSSDPSPS